MKYFTKEARKAQVATLLGFLAPILLYIQTQGEWSWRAFFGAVVSGVVSGASVYATTNAPPTEEIS